MKKLLAVAALTACAAQAQALTLPTDLVGIWGRPESVFADGLIKKGGAIYLDADGQGVSAASDGSSVIGVRLIVKSYEPDSGKLVVDVKEGALIVGTGEMIYDAQKKQLYSANAPADVYERKVAVLSNEVRKAVELDGKPH
ncbi:MAG TPA: hypothetical protein VF472_08270 [Burkholderiaceae bacterium]